MPKRRHDALDPDFWKNIDVQGPDDCWDWRRAKTAAGYGRVQFQGKSTGTHRVAWELTYGAIPEGMVVCHRCDRPSCCNPAHLWLGTPSQNQFDSIQKGRHNSCTGRNLYPRK